MPYCLLTTVLYSIYIVSTALDGVTHATLHAFNTNGIDAVTSNRTNSKLRVEATVQALSNNCKHCLR